MIKLPNRFKEEFIFTLLIGTAFSFLVSLFLLQLFTGILIILYLFEKIENKKRAFDKINLFFLIFIVIRIISIFFSIDFDRSVESFYKDALFYLGLFAFSHYFKAIGYSRMTTVFNWYVVFATVIALTGVIAFNLNYMDRATSILLGTSSYTNHLFVAIAILLFSLKPDINDKKDWLWWSIKGAIIFSGLFLNLSRADITVAVLIVLSAIFLKKLKLKPAVVFILLTVIISGSSIYKNSLVMKSRIEQGTGPSGRSVIWQSALDKLDDRPLIGYGPRTFDTVFTEYDKLEDKAVGSWHNDYITVTMESGFVGLLSYSLFIFFIFYYGSISLWKSKNGEHKNFILGFMASIGGMFLSALLSGFINNPNLSILFVYITGAYTSLLIFHKSE